MAISPAFDTAARQTAAMVTVENDSTSAIAASYQAKAFGIKTGIKIH
jgi:nucleotidyltransferase/DNA polymerase involved in DNA repair